ncbi:MAG: hydrolase [Bacteroidales bacterium]|nr:hydrolase [Bacteroidales bacterium]
MRISQTDTIAVVVDIQQLLFPHIHESEQLEKNCNILIEGLKVLQVPILVTQQYTKRLLPTLDSLSASIGQYEPIEKMAFSCCDEPVFAEELALSGKHTVILFGIETHVCVLQTCIDLVHSGYQPVVVYDCVGSRNPMDKEIAIQRMRQEGAIITSKESLLFELTRTSGTDTFKAISKLVK